MAETFTWCVAPGAHRTRKQRVASSNYGDGYRHRASIGLNINLDSWAIGITADAATLKAVDDFITANAVRGFWWIPPGAAAAIFVTCDEWALTYSDRNAAGLVGSISATFDRCYNLQPV